MHINSVTELVYSSVNEDAKNYGPLKNWKISLLQDESFYYGQRLLRFFFEMKGNFPNIFLTYF